MRKTILESYNQLIIRENARLKSIKIIRNYGESENIFKKCGQDRR